MTPLWTTEMSETACVAQIKLRLRRDGSAAMESVLVNGDLLGLIFACADLGPADVVSVGCVSRLWCDVSLQDASLAIAAARAASCLNKRVLMGLLALSSAEADALPRETRRRWGGGGRLRLCKVRGRRGMDSVRGERRGLACAPA